MSFSNRTTTPASLSRPLVFFPRTWVRMGERDAAVARVIRLRHARHVGLVIRGDTIVIDETQRFICQQYTSSVVQVALAAPTSSGNILGSSLA